MMPANSSPQPLKPGILAGRIHSVAGLSSATKARMWQLFSLYYTDIDFERFHADLMRKQYVICLYDTNDRSLQGFSTIMVMKDRRIAGRSMTIVFSGDTIINQNYWGQTALQRLFASFLLFYKLRRPHQPVVWFLISKGYKTYLLLSRNFVNYWPRHDAPSPAWVKNAIDTLAREMYGDDYKPDRNLLIFDRPMGRLKDHVAAVEERLLQYDDIRFFHTANPGAAGGDELCSIGIFDVPCMVRFTLRTLRKLSRRWLPASLLHATAVRPRHADL